MLAQNNPDRIRIVFDDHRLVANAGLLLPATLARHLGLGELVDHHLDLGSAPGRANTGDKMLTLVASALAGGDCIDDADALRAGGTAGVLGCVVKAPSTLGTSCNSSIQAFEIWPVSQACKSALLTRREPLSRSQSTNARVSRRNHTPVNSSLAICTGMPSSSHRLRTGSRYLQLRVDSGRGQDRTLRLLSALWPPVFAGE